MKRTISILALTLMLASISMPSVAADNSSRLSKKELKVLIATARTPAEHRRIATYYQQQASELRGKAKEHEETAAMYQKQPLPYEGKYSYGTVGFSHCRRFADLFAEQAKEAEALASLHEDMAKAAEHK